MSWMFNLGPSLVVRSSRSYLFHSRAMNCLQILDHDQFIRVSKVSHVPDLADKLFFFSLEEK